MKKPSPSKSVNFEVDKRRFTTFVKVRLEIEGKKEKGVGLNEALMTLLEIMQMGDSSIMWEVYSHNSQLPSGKKIRKKEGIPKSPIEVKKYAYKAKATNEGGTTWTNLRIIHDLAFKDIMDGIYEDLKEYKIGIYEQPVQHFNVVTLGWLMYIPHDIEIKLWTELFKKELKRKEHNDNPIGLSQRKPLDGKKSTGQMNKEDKDFKTVHVEGIGDKSDRLTKEIKTILEGKEIKKLCDTTIRLIPQFDFKESIAFNEKVNV